ncbi:MAG: retropepsin-like domain-containing protein [Burkholderiales bacterium]|nr:retropepsin-like domain-containing protein [Burkholderiales bacterium]
MGWALIVALAVPIAWATPVLLASMGTRASFSMGGALFTLQVGETSHGIHLISLAADSAVIEADGRRTTLKLGQEAYALQRDPASLIASKAPRIVLSNLDLNGFRYPVTISTASGTLPAFVDTRSQYFMMSATHAAKLGIAVTHEALTVYVNTPTGPDEAKLVTVPTLQLENMTLHNVDVAVCRADFPPSPVLGTSIKKQFHIMTGGDSLMLIKREE